MKVLSYMMMFRTNNMVRALQAPLVGPSRDWAIRPIRAGGLLTQPTNYIIINQFLSFVVGRNARDVPAKRHPISHERYEFALYTLC